MGEARRMRENGIQFNQIQPGQQIQVDLKNAIQKVCECGCKYFIPVIALYIVSALVSPTGQELIAQQPVLVCLECKKLLV
jgi:uncharacterized membrane protein